jgi:hypothetical protein
MAVGRARGHGTLNAVHVGAQRTINKESNNAIGADTSLLRRGIRVRGALQVPVQVSRSP